MSPERSLHLPPRNKELIGSDVAPFPVTMLVNDENPLRVIVEPSIGVNPMRIECMSARHYSSGGEGICSPLIAKS
jgi:hypothetical protein